MKQLLKSIIEAEIKTLEEQINVGMDILDELVEALEDLIDLPETPEDLEEALEAELEELIEEHCISASFYVEGNMTIAAVMTEDCPYPLVGIAKCDPTDEFNETVGDIVALKRALGIDVDPSQYGELKIEKDCDNCKHDDLSVLLYPCNKCCESDDENPIGWEPRA